MTEEKEEVPSTALLEPSAESEPTTATTSVSAPSPSPPPPSAAVITAFPCLEQPPRVTLHCRGYYLWSTRKGRLICRTRRSEKDEFRLVYSESERGVVEIHNHKFGGILSVIVSSSAADNSSNNKYQVVCVPKTPETKAEKAAAEVVAKEETTEDDDEEEEEVGGETFEDEPNLANLNTTEEDRKWCFIKGEHGQVLIKSLKTGDHLAIDGNGGKLILTSEMESTDMSSSTPNSATNTTNTTTISSQWDVDCVTGELCFISNPHPQLLLHRSQLRCDMAGLLTLTDAWKGWEVFRIMEASHHYVKISSWMHSQWLLSCLPDGRLTTCSHSESLLRDNPKGSCCQWAIEKAPLISVSSVTADEPEQVPLQGVIMRNKTYGRLLCIKQGSLATYSEQDGIAAEMEGATDDDGSAKNITSSTDPKAPTRNNNNNNWWNINNSVKNIQRRLSSASLQSDASSATQRQQEEAALQIPPKETIVWQLEAAHLQTYYFSSIVEHQKPKSVGPFPQVTTNLRKTDKIQIQRETNGTVRLLEKEKNQYIACNAHGDIHFRDTAFHEDVEWIMDKPDKEDGNKNKGGNVFRSKPHNLYLSYKDIVDESSVAAATASNASYTQSPPPATPATSDSGHGGGGHFSKLFNKEKEIVAELRGISVSSDEGEKIGPREIWNLEPCMPRAVSSEKIATFALGTSIAVGTTIALPFALAGASAILGVMGAEAGVLFNVIAAGLTGAEALASVGAIGATAYIVFRPEENSLTDDHKQDEEEDGERAWSKRPFSNWRNW